MVNTQVERIKRLGTAAMLIIAPLVYMLGQLLQPDIDSVDTGAEQLPILVDNAGRGALAMVICILGLILLIPAIHGLMQLLRERGAWLGLIGGVLAVAGAVLTAATLSAVGLVPFELAENAQGDTAGLEAVLQVLLDNGDGQGAIGAYLGLGFIMLPLGLLLSAIGLWRAGSAPRWAAVVIALGALGFVAGVNHWVRAADAAVLLIGLGAVGVQLLRATRPAAVDGEIADIGVAQVARS